MQTASPIHLKKRNKEESSTRWDHDEPDGNMEELQELVENLEDVVHKIIEEQRRVSDDLSEVKG